MASDASQTPIQAFYEFLGRRLEAGADDLTPAESVREFQLYQEELRRLVQETQPAVEQSRKGAARPLDVDTIMQKVADRLDQQGGS